MPAADALAVGGVVERAPGYGIPGMSVDGQDVVAVRDAARDALQRVRRGSGPTLIECRTYRYKGHSRFEPAKYRSKEELAAWKARDPIDLFEQRCRAEGLMTEEAIKTMHGDVKAEVEAAVELARRSPKADADMARRLVFARS
jgi:TPP-dependent pyruvate/acetoin dehydrogenase alpha subunit